LEIRPFSNESLKKFEETSKKPLNKSNISINVSNPTNEINNSNIIINTNNNPSKLTLGGSTLGGNIDRKKSTEQVECPKSPGRLIKSPRTGESKFISAGIINKSPQMQGKNLNLDKLEGHNVLDALVSKKKSVGITVSGPSEDFKLDPDSKVKHPVRKEKVNVTNLKDNITIVKNVGGIISIQNFRCRGRKRR